MTWSYTYVPSIWPAVLTVLLFTALSIFAWRRRNVPGAASFAIACLFASAWAAGSVMEYAALDLTSKIFWIKFQAATQLPSVTAIACFILEYTWPGRWLTKRNLALLSIIVLLGLGLIFTDDLYHWIWRGFLFDGTVTPLPNTGGWLLIAYGFGLSIINIVVLAWLALRSPQHRWPAALIIISQLAIRVLYLLERTQVVQSALPLDILGLGFSCLVYALALFGFRLFDPVAMARQTLMEQLSDGMLVLDRRGRVASLNPTAERMLALPARQARGKPVRELLPAYPDGQQPLTSGTEIEINLVTGGEIGYYRLAISLLNDWRRQEVGRLLLLRDVTGQKQAQARLLEQQRALAMLHERELLARELHDGIGQVLGYVKMQAQSARDRLAQDQKEIVDSHLAQLVTVAQDAHADVREYILGTKISASSQPGFLPALRQYLSRFSEQYGLRTELNEPPSWSDDLLEPTAAVQLLRIIQEALTNARKHAQAHCIQVSLLLAGSRVQVTIQDDGIGFDPASLTTSTSQKYGLGFMRERAGEVGGVLRVESSPGKGTRVIMEIDYA